MNDFAKTQQKEALACSRFWADNPGAGLCPNHAPSRVRPAQASRRATPHVCPKCSQVPGTYYGKLLGEGEEVPQCPNHGATVDGKWVVSEDAPVLVPVSRDEASAGLRGAAR